MQWLRVSKGGHKRTERANRACACAPPARLLVFVVCGSGTERVALLQSKSCRGKGEGGRREKEGAGL